MRERELGVDLQRGIERACGFDPDERMQVGESLVVERLRLLRCRRGVVVRAADAASAA